MSLTQSDLNHLDNANGQSVEALTAGKLVGFVEWYYHGNVAAT